MHFEALHDMQDDYPAPKVAGDAIVVLALQSQKEFAGWTLNVDRDIGYANAAYQRFVADQARDQEEAKEIVDRQRRQLEEAQRWVDDLEPPPS